MKAEVKLYLVIFGIGLILSLVVRTPAQSPGQCIGYSFATAVPYEVGEVPVDVTTADFNMDGNPDIAAVNYDTHDVSILLGNGSGGFSAAASFPTNFNPQSLTTGDFNLDGKPDIATANSFGNDISILLGDGAGSFAPTYSVGSGLSPAAVISGDFNEDGKTDLAVPGSGIFRVSVLFGDGSGGFAIVGFGVGNSSSSVAADDLNSDGNLDLVTASSLSDDVSVFLGDGAGGFSAAASFRTYRKPHFVTTGDLDSDGNVDILTLDREEEIDWITILFGNGQGHFSELTKLYVGTQLQSIKTSDFNLNGNVDLVTSDQSTNRISIWGGNGRGEFGRDSFGVHAGPRSVAMADFNGDGTPDVAAASQHLNVVSVLLNACPNINYPPVATGEQYVANSGATFRVGLSGVLANDTDPNGHTLTAVRMSDPAHGTLDLRPDGLFSYTPAEGFFGTDSFTYRANDGELNSNIATVVFNVRAVNANDDTVIVPQDGGATTISVLANDTNAHASPLNISSVTQGQSGSVSIANGGTTVTYTPNLGFWGSDSFTYTARGGNGDTDTATVHVGVLRNNTQCSTPAFSRSDFSVGAYPGPVAIRTADLNSDGLLDLVTAKRDGHYVSVLLGTQTGSFGARRDFGTGSFPTSLELADFNTDGKIDIATSGGYDSISILLGDGTGGFATPLSYRTGYTPGPIAVGDINGDNNPDIVMPNGQENGSIMFGNGKGGFAPLVSFAAGMVAYDVTIADLNADGKADLVTTGFDSDKGAILLGDGAGGFASPAIFVLGFDPTSVTAKDINADGKLDLIVTNQEIFVSVLLGNGTGWFAPRTRFRTDGMQALEGTVGDFNGDGHLDIAAAGYTFDNEDGVAILLGNGLGDFAPAVRIVTTGFPWSVVTGDFNYDGKLDMAVANEIDAVVLLNGCGVLLEADVAHRSSGDGLLRTDDITQLRRFLSGAGTPDTSNGEFQRADVSPKEFRGDGAVDSTDVVQVRRYVLGIDARQLAGGPTDPAKAEIRSGTNKLKLASPQGTTEAIRVEPAESSAGQSVTINLRQDPIGREAEYGFSIDYDPAVLLNPVAGAGNAGAQTLECAVQSAGKFSCSLGDFPNNDPRSGITQIGEISSAQNQILMTVTFQVATTALPGTTSVGVSNVIAATDYPQFWRGDGLAGNVTIMAPTAAGVSVSGRVVNDSNKGISAVVTMTSLDGQVYLARSSSFGYFTFDEIPAGQSFIIVVYAKRYRFEPQIVSVNDSVTGLLFAPSQ
jgi:hypothetical protein